MRPFWRVRAARVGVPGEPPRVELFSDGEGDWTGPDGRAILYLKGCEYVDISETPFTNSLPIRRLGLAPGGSAEITVAYYDGGGAPTLAGAAALARLETSDGGGSAPDCESRRRGTAELGVDLDGLLLGYPGLFRREVP